MRTADCLVMLLPPYITTLLPTTERPLWPNCIHFRPWRCFRRL